MSAPAPLELAALGLASSIPAAFLAGRDADLLAPLDFVAPGELPTGPAPVVDRSELAAALAVNNSSYGHPGAERLAARLADPATRVVVTGQQPGLLGGPLYTLTKAISAARWAKRLEADGAPAVAVFWVATEDHDYQEVARTGMFVGQEAEVLTLGEDPAPLTPVGMRSLGPGVTELLDELRAKLPGERFAEWLDRLATWYRPDARFGEAFCRLLAHLLGERCPLLLDAMDPAVKRAEAPWLARLVERQAEMESAQEERDAAVEERGYRLQVAPQPDASPLFLYHDGARRRIHWRDGNRSFALRGADYEGSVATLLDTIRDNPAVVSPGVRGRSVVQDAILGTTLQVLGPGEMAYLPQVAPLYPILGVAPPALTLRPQVVVLERFQLERMEELDLGVAELMAPEMDLDSAVAERAGEDPVAPVRAGVEELLASLEAPALEIDRNLEKPWRKTRDQVLKSLDAFSGRLKAATARRHEVEARRLAGLRTTCRPLGVPQERFISTAYFPGRHGGAFVDALWEQMDLDPSTLGVVTP